MKPKNEINLFVICANLIVGGVLMGTAVNNSFIADTWFGPVFESVPLLNISIAVAFGLLIGAGSYGLFIYSEKAKKTIDRIKDDSERRMRKASLYGLEAMFVIAGIAGLVYRLLFVHTQGIAALVIIGIILELSVPLFGNVLHPIQNPDVQALEEERHDQFSRRVVNDAYAALETTPIANRFQAYRGDLLGALGGAVNSAPQIEAPRVQHGGVLTNRTIDTQPLNPNQPEVAQNFPKALPN